MGVIKPTWQGKEHQIWRHTISFLLFPLNESLPKEYELGFRLTTINAAWSTIESFLRCLLNEFAKHNFDTLDLPSEWKVKYSLCQKIKRFKLNKNEKQWEDFNKKLELKTIYCKRIEDAAWKDLNVISKEMNFDLIKLTKDNLWEFIKHLQNIRNGLMHGVSIKIMKSNFDEFDDEITEKYFKSLGYLEKRKVLKKSDLIATQDINLILNKQVTDLIINETILVLDNFGDIFSTTMTAKAWKEARKDK